MVFVSCNLKVAVTRVYESTVADIARVFRFLMCEEVLGVLVGSGTIQNSDCGF